MGNKSILLTNKAKDQVDNEAFVPTEVELHTMVMDNLAGQN